MSIFFMAFIIAVSAGTWLYSRFYRRTGGNNQTAIIASVTVGIILFIVLYFTLSMVLPK